MNIELLIKKLKQAWIDCVTSNRQSGTMTRIPEYYVIVRKNGKTLTIDSIKVSGTEIIINLEDIDG